MDALVEGVAGMTGYFNIQVQTILTFIVFLYVVVGDWTSPTLVCSPSCCRFRTWYF